MTTLITGVNARLGRANPTATLAWNAWAQQRRVNAAYSTEAYRYARQAVEKIRAAVTSGALAIPPFVDNFTKETPEIREAYHSLLADPMVKAAHLKKVASVSGQGCSVIPADPDAARDVAAAKAFQQVLNTVGVSEPGYKNVRATGPKLIAEEILAGKLINGWSLCEMVKGDGVLTRGPAAGREWWCDFKSKDTRKLTPVIDEFKNVIGVRSFHNAGIIYEGADLDSFVIVAHWPLYCSPGGMSDFRAAYRATWVKDVAMRLRAVGLDRWTMPFLKGTAASEERRAALHDVLEEARGEGFVALSPGDAVEAISLSAGSDAVFASAIQDLNQEILVGITWSHLPHQQGQRGAGGGGELRGDSQVQQQTADAAVTAETTLLNAVVTAQMARPWYARNFADIEPGSVVYGKANEKDRVQRSALYKDAQERGVPLSKKQYQREMGFEQPADEADTLAPAKGGAPGQQPGQPAPAQPDGQGDTAVPFAEAGKPAVPFGWDQPAGR